MRTLALLLGLLTQARLITPFQIMAIALLNGIVMAFDAPSRQAMVVELVGRQNLSNAIALNSVAFNSSRIIGPALAGVFVSAIGMSGCFYLNGISFVPLIAALLIIRTQRSSAPVRNNSALRDLKQGFIFLKGNRLILLLIAIVGITSLFGISYAILMPVFANDILKVGIKGMGLLMAGAGLGALIGALTLAHLGDFRSKGRFLFWCGMVFSFSLVLFGLSRVYLLSFISLIFLGGSSVSSVALINTLLQTRVPDEFRGRVMGVFMLTFAGLTPFGNLISGALAEAFGAPFSLMTGGIICAVFFAIINLRYPQIRLLK